MKLFSFEDFSRGAKTYIDQKVSPLKKPKNSEFYYLTELGDGDVVFECEYIRAYCPSIQYKVVGYYNSALKKKEPQKSTTYSSSTAVHYLDGYMVEKSENYADIPEELVKRVSYINSDRVIESVDELIKKDARIKIRNKVRRAGEHIEAEDIYDIEITQIGDRNEDKESTLDSLLWAKIIRKSDGKLIGYAHQFNGNETEFNFLPDETKAGLDKSLKPVNEPSEPKAPKEKNKKAKKPNKASKPIAERVGEYIGLVLVGIILAAAILLVEFAGIFIYNKGKIDKLEPGIYTITTENYKDFLRVMDNKSDSIESGKRRTDNLTFVNISDNSEVSVIWLAPRTTQFRLSDMQEKSSYSRYSQDIRKYIITNLKIVFEFTYSFNGEMHSETIEHVTPLLEGTNWDSIMAAIPAEAIEESTVLGESIGAFHSTFDFWRVSIISVSGLAEVKEVE